MALHPLVPFLKLEGKYSVFTINYGVSCRVFVDTLCKIEEVPFSFWFVKSCFFFLS